ncbi:fumarylacetoacetate hydrolase family protein, partial [Microbacterium sp. BF1]|uniref:fumarylacetoacetate hydrolase family protein n=1 Tax=Microbacterium sp. BF1 TaxID=2821146 RepID=UPI00211A10EC
MIVAPLVHPRTGNPSGSEPPTIPILFLKTPNTVVGPNDTVTIPRGSEKTDWEVELGIVIGTRTAYLDSPEESLAHVAGFVAANDVSERDFQMTVSGGQWSKGKIAPGFNPTGPWLVTQKWWDAAIREVISFMESPAYAAPDLPELRAALKADLDHEIDH